MGAVTTPPPPIHHRFGKCLLDQQMSARIGKLFSDLSENSFRDERKYLSGSELKIICSEKFLYFRKNYVGKDFCIFGKMMIRPEKFLYVRKNYDMFGKLFVCPHSKRSSDTPYRIM